MLVACAESQKVRNLRLKTRCAKWNQEWQFWEEVTGNCEIMPNINSQCFIADGVQKIKMGLEVRYGWWGLDKAHRASTLWHFQITTNYGVQHPCNWKVYRGSLISTPLFTPYMLYAVVCTIRSMHHTPNIANLYTKFFFTQYASIWY